MGSKISGKDLLKAGFPSTNALNIALGIISRYKKKDPKDTVLKEAQQVLLHPELFTGDGTWGKVAEALTRPVDVHLHELRQHRVPFHIFGAGGIDEATLYQFYNALKLPVAVAGALMPDAHHGYGLPIGGVLATANAVIPYGVGVDIGCRMSLSVFDLPADHFRGRGDQMRNIIASNTCFGMKETHHHKHDHEVFSDPAFREIPFLKHQLDKAYKQLGTSGSGNHFVELGIVDLKHPRADWHLPAGKYVAVLSHSGSRALGANIAKHYTSLAFRQCPLPKQVQHLAWLDLDTHDGREYWTAMNLAGDYAKACHDDIHRRIAKSLGQRVVFNIENHHNFAWKETLDGQECIVHRKGATPAAKGTLGIIPGSMTAPGYIRGGTGQ